MKMRRVLFHVWNVLALGKGQIVFIFIDDIYRNSY